MSDDPKKDLTRIEDLGEFLHELDDTENFLALPDLPEEEAAEADLLPDLPTDEDAFPDFTASEEAPADDAFGSDAFPAEELPASDPFGSDEFSSAKFSSEMPTDADLEEPVTPFELSEETQILSAPDELDEATPPTDLFADESAPVAEDTDAPELAEAQAQLSQLVEEVKSYAPKEDFSETRRFAESAMVTDTTAECNPAYSVMARGIRFIEDSDEILALLKEAGFPEDMRTQFQRQIERGTLLIPRVSEFTAIYLCHKLRRFQLELSMGLSDLLHPPRKGLDADRGLVSRKTLGQNYQHQFQFRGDADAARAIILSTMSQLDGHSVDRYLGVASEHTFLDSEVVENETTDAIHKSYDELALKLKGHALQHKANAVIGINYQLTPMPVEAPGLGNYRYKLTCTGNLVWLHKHTN